MGADQPTQDQPPQDQPSEGRLFENIMHFARVLRGAGLPIGPGQVLDALAAVKAAGIGSRSDFYWTLHAVFVNRRDQRELFDQAFHVFWRNPQLLNKVLGLLLPRFKGEEPDPSQPELAPRIADALTGDRPQQAPDANDQEEVTLDASLTYSERELLQSKDFERMTAAEIVAAKKLIKNFRLPIMEVPTRRYRPHPGGQRVDLRATLRASLRRAGTIPLKSKKHKRRPPPPAGSGGPRSRELQAVLRRRADPGRDQRRGAGAFQAPAGAARGLTGDDAGPDGQPHRHRLLDLRSRCAAG